MGFYNENWRNKMHLKYLTNEVVIKTGIAVVPKTGVKIFTS